MTLRSFENKQPRQGQRIYVDDSAVVIGDVELGDDSSIWPLVVARGDIHSIRIGARTNVQDGSILHVTHAGDEVPDGHPVIIGNDVTIGHQVMLHGCTIGDRCLIGMSSIVLDGVVIEPEVMLGAGSLVAPGKRLESGYLYLGRPARRVRPLTEAEISKLSRSANYYVELKNRHLA